MDYQYGGEFKLMELVIAQKETFGKLVFLSAEDWVDFKTHEKKGIRIKAVGLNEYDKFSVKIADKNLDDYQDLKEKSYIEFDNLRVEFFVIKGKKIISFLADDVKFKNSLELPKISV